MIEVLNFDGLVGPSHNYGGLAEGNLASNQHQGEISSPRVAALQGLEKMRELHQAGLPQGFIPPPLRPDLTLLHRAGFHGSPAQQLQQAWEKAPKLLEACYSASAMWAANSATVTASVDSIESRLQITPANLISSLHRSIEAQSNQRFFAHCFNDKAHYSLHPPLPSQTAFADEGAANHCRLSDMDGEMGLNLFIYGRSATESPTLKYPARQSKLACESLIRQHQIKNGHWLLLQQTPKAIDSGAFHNDVVAVAHRNMIFLHEEAFIHQADVLKQLRNFSQQWQAPLYIFEVSANELSLSEAVSTYLFNSQLVSRAHNEMILIAPEESRSSARAATICEKLVAAENPITEVRFVDLRQSMNNGGGPACLRLAVPLTDIEKAGLNDAFLISETRYHQLRAWIKRHYRDQLAANDLRDPLLRLEMIEALEDLAKIFAIPHYYD